MPQVTVTKLVEGEAHVVIRLVLLADGSGNLRREVIFSPTDLVPPRKANRVTFRIMQIWYGMSGFDAEFGFNVISPEPAWTLARGTDSWVDFRLFGGLLQFPETPPEDVDGKLWLSTTGFITAGQTGSFVLELRKTNRP